MANTTNFGWETPDDTDLVKDGAAAMRTLGNAIDTSFVDLKGGTTGQVLSKASNTDLDYTWVTTDDANAIQNAIVDAKGDLIAASANDTPARLAVGSNGDTLLADSSQTTGLRWGNNLGFTAGKNKIINGDFGIWQRGTSFSNPADNTFCADRYRLTHNGTSVTRTVSQQTFTPGTAPVSGYEGQYFFRYAISAAGSGNTYNYVNQKIEDVRTFAGQTVTLSFWGKADASRSVTLNLLQFFGSGGSASVDNSLGSVTLTTSWVRYTATVSVASISGKTVGTGSALELQFSLPSNTTMTIDIWGVQVEAGSVATAFQTATGTLAGELAAAMRYYQRPTNTSQYALYGYGTARSTTQADVYVQLATPMRVAPTAVDYSTIQLSSPGVAGFALSALTIDSSSNTGVVLLGTTTGLTQYRSYALGNNGTTGYLGLTAEL